MRAVLVAVCLLIFTQVAAAQDPKGSTSAPPRATGPSSAPTGQLRMSGNVYIGELAPDFELTNARGRPIKLSRLRGHSLLLAFAERREDLRQFREILPLVSDLDVTIVCVCADKPQTLKTYVERDSIPYEMLSDATREVAAIYGLLDRERTWILPGFLLLDANGIVKMALIGRLPPTEQIAELTRFVTTGL
jgi:peroxiredoxin